MTPKQKKKKRALKKQWVKYLSDSRLPKEEIYRRANEFTRKGMKVDE